MTDHATWVSFTNDELTALQSILVNGVSYLDPMREKLLAVIANFTSPEAKDQRYRDAAADLNFVSEGECEIDDYAVTSVSEDGGAYVMAWVWVYNEDAGIETDVD